MKRRLSICFRALLMLAPGLGVALAPRAHSVDWQSGEGYAHPEMLVETDWLANHLKDPDLRAVDLRSAEAYAKGHIKNAVHVDQGRLRNPEDRLLYVPPPAEFATMMSELGISNTTRIIPYDDVGGTYAARLWFMLDYYGHAKVSLLNGGWQKWAKEGRDISTEAPSVSKAEFKIRTNASSVCAVPEIVSKLKKPDVVIVDARSPEEYKGERVVGKRGGHIPGAVNVDWRMNLTGDEVRVFKSATELRRMYESLGITKGKEIITYCQSGGRAAHALFTLRLLGYTRSRNYYDSWQDWSNREDLPVDSPKTN